MGFTVKRFALLWLLVLALIFPVLPAAQADTGLSAQLIADQESATVGETVRYHLLYHNPSLTALAEVKLQVELPPGLELVAEGDVQWDPITRLALWSLTEVEAGGARAIHFSARVTEAAQLGTALPVSLGAFVGASVNLEVDSVTLQVGPALHQPLFIGFPDGKFHPTASLTRAEAAAIVARVKQLPAGTATFEDVPASHWAYNYIARASSAGYMTGSQGQFRPEEPLSRAELVVLLLRLRGVTALPFAPFAETTGHWAAEAISTARALAWIDGDGLGQFLPDGPTERQVAAKLFTIALYRRPLVDGEAQVKAHFPDVDRNHWAFPWIEEVSMEAHESRTDGLQEFLIRYRPDQTHPL